MVGRKCNPKNEKSKKKKYMCNPQSGRWVLKDGLVGKKTS